MINFKEIYRKIIIFNLFAIIVIFIVFEILARCLMYNNPPFNQRFNFNIDYRPSGFVVSFPKPNQVIYEFENGIINYNKFRFKINSYGYRGENFPIKKEKNETRIVIMGGSHIFDIYAFEYEGNFGLPFMIQDLFNNNGNNIRVINAGMPGDDTRKLFTKVIMDLYRYQPDIFIINSIWNDIKWISRTDDSTLFLTTAPQAVFKNPMIEEVNILDKILGFSMIYRKGRDFYWNKKLNLGKKEVNEGIIANRDVNFSKNGFTRGLEQYKQNIIATVQAIRNINAIPILAIEERFVSTRNTDKDKKLIQYHSVNVESHEELVSLFEKCDSILREISIDYEVPLIDANQGMEGNPMYFVDHVHTTPMGSKLIANYYYEFLKPFVKKQ